MNITALDFARIRHVYHLTMDEYGLLLGITAAYVNNIEKGKCRFTERVKQRLVEELELTPEKLQRILSIYDEYQLSGGTDEIN